MADGKRFRIPGWREAHLWDRAVLHYDQGLGADSLAPEVELGDNAQVEAVTDQERFQFAATQPVATKTPKVRAVARMATSPRVQVQEDAPEQRAVSTRSRGERIAGIVLGTWVVAAAVTMTAFLVAGSGNNAPTSPNVPAVSVSPSVSPSPEHSGAPQIYPSPAVSEVPVAPPPASPYAVSLGSLVHVASF